MNKFYTEFFKKNWKRKSTNWILKPITLYTAQNHYSLDCKVFVRSEEVYVENEIP